MISNGPNDSAFPSFCEINGKEVIGSNGATMREWYAAQALQAILIGDQMPERAEGYSRLMRPLPAAKLAFEYADAMLWAAKQPLKKTLEQFQADEDNYSGRADVENEENEDYHHD